MSAIIVDSVESVRNLIKVIENASPQPPFIFIDLEGVNLSRHGSVAIMQVLVPPARTVYLVDVHRLEGQAFETLGATGMTLKTILESEDFPKVFFDIRNDSDALYSHFKIDLRGIVDLQLIEFATRPTHGRLLNGLAKCISRDVSLSWTELRKFDQVKDAGKLLFAPERGGKYEVFHERPLPTAIIDYCVQDVMVMPQLLMIYGSRLEPRLALQIQEETSRRVKQSQSPSFNGKGRHMAEGPSHIFGRASKEVLTWLPLSIVCSPDLRKHCTLRTSEQEQQVAVAALSELPVVQSPSSQTEASVLEQIRSLSISRADSETKKEQGVSAIAAKSPTEPSPPTQSTASVLTTTEMRSTEASLEDGTVTDLSNQDVEEHDREYAYLDDDFSQSHNWRSDDESEKDFTACSASDCGYCGHCGY